MRSSTRATDTAESPPVSTLLEAAAAALAAVGAAAWLDALRLALPSSPALPAWEAGELAREGGRWLAPAVLATILAGWARRRIRGRWMPLTMPVLAGWAAALALMAIGGWGIKIGWPAGAILLGVAAAGLARRLLPAPERPGRRAPAAILAAAALWAPALLLPSLFPAAGPPALPGPQAPPSIVFVLIDALRADRMGAWGHHRPTSPEMDALAARGVTFRRAVAPSSWTPPAMASILTSTTVGMHGLVEKGQGLPGESLTLAGRLRDAGYRTAAFTTNPWLKPVFGFDDGFQQYWDLDRLGLRRRLLGVQLKNWVLRRLGAIRVDPELVPGASEVTRRALGWLRERGDRPFFLYLHYMDVHSPYDAAEPWHGAFCRGHDFGLPDHELEAEFRKERLAGDPEVLEHVLELYDEEILATDHAVGALARGMEEMGLDRSTVLVITADHGEEFYDHGGVMHGRTLYQEVVRVPLIILPPSRERVAPALVDRRVSTMDFYPTVLDLAGLPVPGGIAGRSLAGWLGREGAPADPERIVGSQLFREGWSWTAIYLDDDKFIRRRPLEEGVPVEPSVLELYHLGEDPGERRNAAPREEEAAGGLALVVEGYERVWGVPGLREAREAEEMDAETLRQLKALGYID